MSLFDSLKSRMAAVIGGSPEAAAAAEHPGLFAGVAEMIEKEALGPSSRSSRTTGWVKAVSSWTGKGQNLPISGEMLHKVLGPENIEAIAQKAGLPAGEATALLAKVFPGVVDHLTPDGVVEPPPAAN